MKVTIHTAPCIVCGERGFVEVDEDAFNTWRQGVQIQKAMPMVPAALREQLMNGTHPKCFDELFPPEDD